MGRQVSAFTVGIVAIVTLAATVLLCSVLSVCQSCSGTLDKVNTSADTLFFRTLQFEETSRGIFADLNSESVAEHVFALDYLADYFLQVEVFPLSPDEVRVRRIIRHVDPWSVLKMSLVFRWYFAHATALAPVADKESVGDRRKKVRDALRMLDRADRLPETVRRMHDKLLEAAKSGDVGQLVERLGQNKQGINIVILDACRNNPFSGGTVALPDGRRLTWRGAAPAGRRGGDDHVGATACGRAARVALPRRRRSPSRCRRRSLPPTTRRGWRGSARR